MCKVLFIFIFFSVHFAYSAPFPGVATSELVKKNLILSELGFKISSQNTNWERKRFKKKRNILAAYSPIKKSADSPMLTLRVDSLKQTSTLKTYIKKWIHDYPKLGFDIKKSKRVKVGKNIGYLLDLKHSKLSTQLRQVIFVKNKTVAVLTCRADKNLYKKYIKDCNQILKNFEWTL